MDKFNEYAKIKQTENYLLELLEDFNIEQETVMEVLELLDIVHDTKKEIRAIIVINNPIYAHN